MKRNAVKHFYAVMICISLVTSPALSEDRRQTSLDDLERLYAIEKLGGDLTGLEVAVKRISADKKYKCLRAFGNQSFCECVTHKTPVGTSFEHYLVATMSSDEELNFKGLNDREQNFITLNRNARNQCVESGFK